MNITNRKDSQKISAVRFFLPGLIISAVLCILFGILSDRMVASHILFDLNSTAINRNYLRQFLEFTENITSDFAEDDTSVSAKDFLPSEQLFLHADILQGEDGLNTFRTLYSLINDESAGMIEGNGTFLINVYKSAMATWIVDRESREPIIRSDYLVFYEGETRILADIRVSYSDGAYEALAEAFEKNNEDPYEYTLPYMDRYVLRNGIAYPLQLSLRKDGQAVTVFSADLTFDYSDSEVVESDQCLLRDGMIKPLDPIYLESRMLAEERYDNFCKYEQVPPEYMFRRRGYILNISILSTDHYVGCMAEVMDYSSLLNRLTAIGCAVILLLGCLVSLILYRIAKRKAEKQEYEKAITNALAHNYKSSLMIIRSSAENLLSGVSEEKKAQYEQKIMDEADHMSESTEKLLSFYRTGTAVYQPTSEKIDASALCRELIRKYESVSTERNLKWFIEDGEKYLPEGDPVLFSMALDNLIGNAVKYALEGTEIRITTRKDGMALENQWKPIEKFLKKPKLFFEAFVTGDDQPGRSNSGIGLSVTRDLLQRMGLRIEAAPTEEKVVFVIR